MRQPLIKNFETRLRLLPCLLFTLTILAAGPLYGGTCANPIGNEADIIYNQAYSTYQFCNGTSWIAYGGGLSCAASSGSYSPTFPAGSGYFVLTKTTYNGNLGGLSGANAKCLTELTTNTGWKGYATANSNGQLVATKVFAFLCLSNIFGGGGICNNLMPLTTYTFANAGNSAAGGASFTTDTNGLGPNDSAYWSAANYFSGTYSFWTERLNTGTTVWPPGSPNNGGGGHCNQFTSSGSGDIATTGVSTDGGVNRWAYNYINCAALLPLVCFVNP